MTSLAYASYFPFEKSRSEQDDAIAFAIEQFESGKRFVVLELPTGIGKSAIGITVARYLDAHGNPSTTGEDGLPVTGAYILTSQKVLQDQYVKDFGPDSRRPLLRTIKSSSNYTCRFYADSNCAESKSLLRRLSSSVEDTDFQRQCKSNCVYTQEKKKFVECPIGVTNFAYFLAETQFSGALTPRSVLVVDECHNVESELSKFVEVSYSEKFAKDVLRCRVPKRVTQSDVFEWISTTYRSSLKRVLRDMEKTLAGEVRQGKSTSESSKRHEMLVRHAEKLSQFIDVYTESNWVMNTSVSESDRRGPRRFEFKPVDVSPFGVDMFKMGDKVLMMSATVLDISAFCRSIGLKREEVGYMRLPSPFPKENRPVHYIPVGSMSKREIDASLPVLIETLKLILERHADVKGIIHTGNYKIAKHLKEALRDPRIIDHGPLDRDKALKDHVESASPTVLLSPSMTEGIDLSDDASRFQVICKIPFPYLGDEVVKKRMERDPSWYPYVTAKTIVQSLGRSIRSRTDHAVSYILDRDWERFYQRNRSLFPDDFHETIVRLQTMISPYYFVGGKA